MYTANFLSYLQTTAAKDFPICLRGVELCGLDDLTPEQRGIMDAVIAAYDPLPAAQTVATSKIRESCRQYIYAFYSQEKQLNIGHDEAARATAPPPPIESMYTSADFLRMHEFKNEARVICNIACGEVAAAENVEQVDAIMSELEHLYGLEV